MPATFLGAGDQSLETWVKQKEPMIATPPPDMNLVGWRDPYIFETLNDQDEREWGMLLGSGIKGRGGSVMIYRSKSLRAGDNASASCSVLNQLLILLEETPRPLHLMSQIQVPHHLHNDECWFDNDFVWSWRYVLISLAKWIARTQLQPMFLGWKCNQTTDVLTQQLLSCPIC